MWGFWVPEGVGGSPCGVPKNHKQPIAGGASGARAFLPLETQ